jgi:hypothetical protein
MSRRNRVKADLRPGGFRTPNSAFRIRRAPRPEPRAHRHFLSGLERPRLRVTFSVISHSFAGNKREINHLRCQSHQNLPRASYPGPRAFRNPHILAHRNRWCTCKRRPGPPNCFFASFSRGEKNLSGPRRSQAVPAGPKRTGRSHSRHLCKSRPICSRFNGWRGRLARNVWRPAERIHGRRSTFGTFRVPQSEFRTRLPRASRPEPRTPSLF